MDDFDGLLDIVTSDYDQCGPMHFFHNNGDGTFPIALLRQDSPTNWVD